ncbi:hypothetical protein D9619_007087 [Psilocybe cf. subviscida]|uniref:Uncharacterized protein n=1 Tax=Psilocybe cf. subviscida TaxID=2480587 RepID=A0A8H5B194_9AGAR|nr:hypothetical protein D9619_007087 [Psilocybe cf. subviscida]
MIPRKVRADDSNGESKDTWRCPEEVARREGLVEVKIAMDGATTCAGEYWFVHKARIVFLFYGYGEQGGTSEFHSEWMIAHEPEPQRLRDADSPVHASVSIGINTTTSTATYIGK